MAEIVVDASAIVDLPLGNELGGAVGRRLAGHALHATAHLDPRFSPLGAGCMAQATPRPKTSSRRCKGWPVHRSSGTVSVDLLVDSWVRRHQLARRCLVHPVGGLAWPSVDHHRRPPPRRARCGRRRRVTLGRRGCLLACKGSRPGTLHKCLQGLRGFIRRFRNLRTTQPRRHCQVPRASVVRGHVPGRSSSTPGSRPRIRPVVEARRSPVRAVIVRVEARARLRAGSIPAGPVGDV